MFSAPSSKKRVSSSAETCLSSKIKGGVEEAISEEGSDSFLSNSSSLLTTQVSRQSPLILLKSSIIFASRIFKESLNVLKRWFHLSLRVIFISFNSLTNHLLTVPTTPKGSNSCNQLLYKRRARAFNSNDHQFNAVIASLAQSYNSNNKLDYCPAGRTNFYCGMDFYGSKFNSGKRNAKNPEAASVVGDYVNRNIGEEEQRHRGGRFWHWNLPSTIDARDEHSISLATTAQKHPEQFSDNNSGLLSRQSARQTSILDFQGQLNIGVGAFLATDGDSNLPSTTERAARGGRSALDGTTTTTTTTQLAARHHDAQKSANQFKYGTTNAQASTSRGTGASSILADLINTSRHQHQQQHNTHNNTSDQHHYALYINDLFVGDRQEGFQEVIRKSRSAKSERVQEELDREEVEIQDEFENNQMGCDGATKRIDDSMVLLSRESLSDLTNQIAASMNKMRNLEEQVKVIPELQRQLEFVISDANASNSVKDYNQNTSNINSAIKLDPLLSSSKLFNHNIIPTTGNLGCGTSTSGLGSSRRESYNSTSSNQLNNMGSNDNISQRYQQQQTNNLQDLLDNVQQHLPRHTPINKHHHKNLTDNPILFDNSNCVHGPIDAANCTSEQAIVFCDRTNSSKVLNTRSPFKSTPPTSPAHSNHIGHNSSTHHLTSTSSNPLDHHSLFRNQQNHHHQNNGGRLSFNNNNNNMPSNLLITSMPIKTQLDCGCQSFKEHLKYNNISREQRLNNARQWSTSTKDNQISSSSDNSKPQTTPQHQARNTNQLSVAKKCDASTMTDLLMEDIVSRNEHNNTILNIHQTYSTLSIYGQSSKHHQNYSTNINKNFQNSLGSDSSSVSSVGNSKNYSKSTSETNSIDTKSDVDEEIENDKEPESNNVQDYDNYHVDGGTSGSVTSSNTSNKCVVDEEEQNTSDKELSEISTEDDDEDQKETQQGSSGSKTDEPYSIGSSYQDPSDFEEYCAYGESIDRRTKDFMSQSTKIPNDLRFALIRLNDFIKDRSLDQSNKVSSILTRNNVLETSLGYSSSSSVASAGCIRVITEKWFAVTTKKDSDLAVAKLYLDYFESFTKQLLNTVVNLVDSAGNTAMHYAASHLRLDIIELLLNTKVCDVNCKNKAGYTPIMLLALTDITQPKDQEIARSLFSMGDVNIKARSSGQTSLMLSATNGCSSTCRLLLESGADPNLQDNDGSTALMSGSELGYEQVVRCLLANKLTDISATDNDGLDALTIAMKNGNKNVACLLYAAKNVPKMILRPSPSRSINNNNHSTDNKNNLNRTKPVSSNSTNYLEASLRRTRGKTTHQFFRRTDSLTKSRIARLIN